MVLTYKQKFNKKYGFSKDEDHSIKEISNLTGFKLSGLKTIFSKGKGAYFTNPTSVRPVVKKSGGANRWAYARIYSSVMGGKAKKYDEKHLIKK
tara:strand:- start:16 stop:297 length:282 start_codon:yes stop_codon:yes gene_type:complete